MTEREMDAVMRQALLDAIALEWADTEGSEPQRGSARYERSLAAMCRDPLKWCRRRTRPVWKKVLQTAAMFALVCALALGSLLAVSPTARAIVRRWFVAQTDSQLSYTFDSQSLNGAEIPRYVLTTIPDGYELEEVVELSTLISYVYYDSNQQWLSFTYLYMQDGSEANYDISNVTIKPVSVNGCSGYLLLSNDIKNISSAIVWVDESQSIQFTIHAHLPAEGLLALAESVELKK